MTEAFLQHYNEERPRKATSLWECASSCGLSDLAHVTGARHRRGDPDAWLAPLDQKMYLRHVGRDPRVDVDLATYDIGPQMAGRAVLLQLEAESRQFAVWHQDQIVKRLPIKGLVGQEMALDDYLKYIQQEALAAPRRSSARSSRKVRQPSRMASKEPDFFLHVQTFSVACLVLMQVRGACSLLAGQRHREQEEICCVDNPRI